MLRLRLLRFRLLWFRLLSRCARVNQMCLAEEFAGAPPRVVTFGTGGAPSIRLSILFLALLLSSGCETDGGVVAADGGVVAADIVPCRLDPFPRSGQPCRAGELPEGYVCQTVGDLGGCGGCARGLCRCREGQWACYPDFDDGWAICNDYVPELREGCGTAPVCQEWSLCTDGFDPGVLDAGSDAGPRADGGFDGGPRLAALGEACTAEVPCLFGECRGSSCGETWTCVAEACGELGTRFCGCHGMTVSSPETCPKQPWIHTGPCVGPEGFDCDPRGVMGTCVISEPPACPTGQVPDVDGSGACWTRNCVPLTDCACADSTECPGTATCDGPNMRCEP